MTTIKLGDTVTLATITNVIFTVVAENADGSFEIEAKLDGDNTLRYGNIAKEMMKIIG
jgi:hypothetical protein